MRAIFDFTNNTVVAWGILYDSPEYDGIAFNVPDDYSPERYSYIPSISGVYDPNGFVLRPQSVTIDEARRRNNINRMSSYMAGFIGNGLTQANYDLFLSDTAALQQQYIAGGGRLITWIETANRNGYNATTIGFKTRAPYNGIGVAQTSTAFNERANAILLMLNDL